MSNIQTIISGATAVSLGPVEIKQVYELRQVTMGGQKVPKLGLLVFDGSGQTIVNIMGAAANGNFAVGESITLQAMGERGKLEPNEYNNRVTITAWHCQVAHNPQDGGATQREAPRQHSPSNSGYGGGATSSAAGTGSEKMTLDEWAHQVWSCVDALGRTSNDYPNIPDSVKDFVMSHGGHLGPLWWFGDRKMKI